MSTWFMNDPELQGSILLHAEGWGFSDTYLFSPSPTKMSENKINCMGVIFFLFYPSFLSLVIIYMRDKTFLALGNNTTSIPFRTFKRGFFIFLMPSIIRRFFTCHED